VLHGTVEKCKMANKNIKSCRQFLRQNRVQDFKKNKGYNLVKKTVTPIAEFKNFVRGVFLCPLRCLFDFLQREHKKFGLFDWLNGV